MRRTRGSAGWPREERMSAIGILKWRDNARRRCRVSVGGVGVSATGMVAAIDVCGMRRTLTSTAHVPQRNERRLRSRRRMLTSQRGIAFPPAPSERVKGIARDPARKSARIEAIKA
jgi:transcription initiation factor TFIIIB Brf1 subunit/transcription initiation factor TFIIB